MLLIDLATGVGRDGIKLVNEEQLRPECGFIILFGWGQCFDTENFRSIENLCCLTIK